MATPPSTPVGSAELHYSLQYIDNKLHSLHRAWVHRHQLQERVSRGDGERHSTRLPDQFQRSEVDRNFLPRSPPQGTSSNRVASSTSSSVSSPFKADLVWSEDEAGSSHDPATTKGALRRGTVPPSQLEFVGSSPSKFSEFEKCRMKQILGQIVMEMATVWSFVQEGKPEARSTNGGPMVGQVLDRHSDISASHAASEGLSLMGKNSESMSHDALCFGTGLGTFLPLPANSSKYPETSDAVAEALKQQSSGSVSQATIPSYLKAFLQDSSSVVHDNGDNTNTEEALAYESPEAEKDRSVNTEYGSGSARRSTSRFSDYPMLSFRDSSNNPGSVFLPVKDPPSYSGGGNGPSGGSLAVQEPSDTLARSNSFHARRVVSASSMGSASLGGSPLQSSFGTGRRHQALTTQNIVRQVSTNNSFCRSSEATDGVAASGTDAYSRSASLLRRPHRLEVPVSRTQSLRSSSQHGQQRPLSNSSSGMPAAPHRLTTTSTSSNHHATDRVITSAPRSSPRQMPLPDSPHSSLAGLHFKRVVSLGSECGNGWPPLSPVESLDTSQVKVASVTRRSSGGLHGSGHSAPVALVPLAHRPPSQGSVASPNQTSTEVEEQRLSPAPTRGATQSPPASVSLQNSHPHTAPYSASPTPPPSTRVAATTYYIDPGRLHEFIDCLSAIMQTEFTAEEFDSLGLTYSIPGITAVISPSPLWESSTTPCLTNTTTLGQTTTSQLITPLPLFEDGARTPVSQRDLSFYSAHVQKAVEDVCNTLHLQPSDFLRS